MCWGGVGRVRSREGGHKLVILARSLAYTSDVTPNYTCKFVPRNRDVRNFTVSYGNLRTVKINTWRGQRRKFGGLKIYKSTALSY